MNKDMEDVAGLLACHFEVICEDFLLRDLFAAAAMIANPNDSLEQHFTDADGMMKARKK